MTEIADGDILSDIELEVTSACGQNIRALDSWSPDKIAVDDTLDVLENGITVIACFREFRIWLLLQAGRSRGRSRRRDAIDSMPGRRHPDSLARRREGT